MSKKFKIKNNSLCNLTIVDPSNQDMLYSFPNTAIIKEFEIEKLMEFYGSYPRLFEEGYVIPINKEVYTLLGIDESVVEKIKTVDEIKQVLVNGNEEEVENVLDEAPSNIKENIVEVAKNEKIDSRKKAKVIKDKTGVDITNIEE